MIWHVQQDLDKAPLRLADAQFPIGAETNWWYCTNCMGMHFLGNAGSPGLCPAGGYHQTKPNVLDYRLPMDNPSAPGEHGWWWCFKCQGLFYGPNQASSHCVAGGTHDGSNSADYSLLTGAPRPYDSGWRRCVRCQSLFYAQGTSSGVCPGGQGLGHLADTTAYSPPHRMDYITVAAEGVPDLGYGINAVWGSGTTTPYLRHYDFTPTHTTIQVHPFASGTNSITVEWLTTEDIWVDFGNMGAENGTFDFPFNTFAEGVQTVPYAGTLPVNTLHIKAGSSAETARITKPMHIRA